MELLAALFQSGRIAEIALGFIGIEAVLLVALRRRLGGHVFWASLAHLASGAALLLALRSALLAQPWQWTAGFLLAALLAHGLDLAARLSGALRSRS